MTPLLALRRSPELAFESLYQRHVGDVYRYALALLGNPADAEDVTQTTFLNAYRAFQRGEQPRNPHNWLRAIAHNVCRQRFRQAARRPHEVALTEETAAAVAADEDAPSLEDLRRALQGLTLNQRAALVMREFGGCSQAEIADTLGLSVAAVEALLFRARRALREQLENQLACGEAEQTISRQLDGRLARRERAALRAHLRGCDHCSRFARRLRAQRKTLAGLAALPPPSSLSSFFGSGTGAASTGGGSLATAALATKLAASALTVAVAAGVGYEGVHHPPWQSSKDARVAGPVSPRGPLRNRAALSAAPAPRLDPFHAQHHEARAAEHIKTKAPKHKHVKPAKSAKTKPPKRKPPKTKPLRTKPLALRAKSKPATPKAPTKASKMRTAKLPTAARARQQPPSRSR